MEERILYNYLCDTCSEEERRKVEAWLQDNDSNVQAFLDLIKRREEYVSEVDKNEMKAGLMERVRTDAMENISAYPENSKALLYQRKHPILPLLLTIAAVLLISVFVGYKGMQSFQNSRDEQSVAFKEISIPAGRTSTITLGDGTKIKLNSESTLKYPESFHNDLREVFLDGEAYFQVAREESRPFVVHTNDVTTTVLGTEFNIKAYGENSDVQVAVNSGRVKVESDDTPTSEDHSVILEKYQWATYSNDQHLLQKEEGEAIYSMLAWKDGILIFDENTVSEVAEKLTRWYGADVILEDKNGLEGCTISGKHENESLKDVLNVIAYISGIEYRFTEQNRVILSGGSCK